RGARHRAAARSLTSTLLGNARRSPHVHVEDPLVHEYEIVFIIRPDLDDADTLAAVERVETTVAETEGHLLERDDWGKRRLAYLVQKHAKGHYILLRILSSPTQILEIERKMRLDDRIIRFLTV